MRSLLMLHSFSLAPAPSVFYHSSVTSIQLPSGLDHLPSHPTISQLLVVTSTGQRNTLPLRRRWSVMRQRRKRRFFTAAESADIWDRWRRGEGLKSIGRVFGKSSSSIFAHICPTGGIRPPPRRRSRLALTLAEREEISRGLAHGHSLRRIACSLERAPSTVSREIARNGGCGPYP